MLLPIGDENPREKTPYVNYTLLGINIAVFLFTLTLDQATVLRYAMIPKNVSFQDPASLLTLLTSMFLHGGILHLAGNMLFLWIFGDNIEDKLGHIPYLLFYLACGFGADFAHIYVALNVFTTVEGVEYAAIPTVGASGAISGVLGAYILFFPRHKVKVLFFFFIVTVFRWSAWVWIGIWFLEQLIFSMHTGSGVAYFAHIGGFLAGLAMGAIAKFVAIPRRFVQAGSFYPKELAAPSRWGDRSRTDNRPLITIEDDGQEVFRGPVQVVDRRYALLRTSDELSSVLRIATIAAPYVKEPVPAIARRLSASRGMILRNVHRVPAEHVQIELRKVGIPTLLVPCGPGYEPPTPVDADRVTWDDRTVKFTWGSETQVFPWSTPFLYLAAVVSGGPVVDTFVTPRLAFRASARTIFVHVDWTLRRETRLSIREFAQAIAERHRGAAINDGVRVLASRGSWGWLVFRNPEDYEDYVFWLYTLLLSRRPVTRVR